MMPKVQILFFLYVLNMVGIEIIQAQPTVPSGIPFIETYQRGQFVGARQTWGITRADDGLLYFGNTRYGIQESDGLTWRNIGMEKNSAALSFAKRKDGVIFVGGQNDFGFLKRDSLLQRSYTSLAHLLPDSAVNILDVEFTYVLNNEVQFISPKIWYTYSDEKVTWQKNNAPIYSAAQWNNSIITLDSEGQIIRTREGNTITISPPNNTTIPVKLSAAKHRLFMLDKQFVVWELTESNTWSMLFKLSNNIPVASETVKDFLWSEAGYIHIATSNGLFTYNQVGEYMHTIFDTDGLCDNDLVKLYEDDAQNIWVTSLFGISVLEYGRAMREFSFSAHNFPEYSATLKNFNDSLYVGGNNGLYVWDNGKFRQKYGDRSVYAFDLTPYGLLIGSSKGLQLLDKTGHARTLFSGGRVDLILSDRENLNVVYYSHDGSALRKVVLTSENQFIDTKLIDFEEGGFTLTEDVNGDLWVGTGRNGNVHFETIQEDSVIVSISNTRNFTTDNGLPTNGFNYTMAVGQDVGFITSDGFYRLTSDRDSIVIDHRFDKVFYGQDRAVWPVVQDNKGGIWLAWAAAHIGKAVYNRQQDTFEWIDGEFTRISPYRDIDFIYPVNGSRVYFQTYTQKLAYFDSSLYKQPVPSISAHITSVVINSDSVLLQPRGIPHTILEAPISYKDNKIRIYYGMIAFLPEDRLFYQIKLEGLDDEWSSTTNERYRDYTNLKEGSYTFWVRGYTLYPEDSELASFSFIIVPPWYRAWWAYIVYAFSGLGAIVVVVKIREKNLLNRQQVLEHEILTRTEEIRAQKEQLEEVNKMKSRFFANISHEFRTPLTLSEGLINKVLGDPSLAYSVVQSDLTVAKRNMVRLHDMVDQIIDLTKADHDQLTLVKKYYHADSLVSISVESFRSLAEYHGHNFVFAPNAKEAILFADRSKVEIIINNLISNAIKFTPDGGTISIKTSQKANNFVFTIQDSGLGIQTGQEEAIFERFHRIKRENADYVEGMGVGLDLSRTLARHHDGDIEVDTTYNQGARFCLRLPTFEVLEGELTSTTKLLDDNLLYAEKQVGVDTTDIQYDILLVEDNEDIRHYVADMLSDIGLIRTAKNGKEALELLVSFTPDIIVTDLMMPIMGGLELVETLKNHPRWNNIPVMVLTAKALEQDKLHLLRIGVVDYITKPFLPEQLVLKVKNLLNYYTRRKAIRVKVKADEVSKASTLSEKAAAFISNNISNTNLSVDMLADEFSQSRRSFYRNIQIETGMSPGEFIRELRLTKARALVAASQNFRLEEIAIAVGYKSATSFRKIYEDRFGEHPLSQLITFIVLQVSSLRLKI